MYRINWVEITNFRSFFGTHKWILKPESGLFQITGINNDNPRLDKNGLGKSSLLDAVSWCLHGKTSRGLRGPDIVNDDSTSCDVCVNLDVKDENLTVRASQNPNSLYLNNSPIDRDNLSKRLVLSHEAFLYSVMIPQFGDAFLDLTPSMKLSLFSDIVNLDWCLVKSNEAQKRADDISSRIRSIEIDVSSLKAAIESDESTIQSLKLKASAWSHDQKARIKTIEDKVKQNLDKVVEYRNEIASLEEVIELINDKIKELEPLLLSEKTKISEFDEELIEANKEIAIINHQITSTKDTQSRLKGVGSLCPTCNQDVDPQHIASEVKKFEKKLKALFADRTDLDKAVDAIKDDLNHVRRVGSAITIELNENKSRVLSAKGNKSSVLREVEYINRENSELEAKIKQIESEQNVFQGMVDEKYNKIQQTMHLVTNKILEISNLNEANEATKFWVSGFKKLRLFIIEETLRSLEIEVNNNLVSLGLPNWSIEFDVERENKSGGITKGFTTRIIKPSGKAIKYEALCGGEVQRVRLATCFGLADLIMERSGLTGMTEFFDELSQHMTDSGVDDMLETLKDRATKTGKQIWVIDHRSTAFSDFDGTLMIEKNSDGSKLLGA